MRSMAIDLRLGTAYRQEQSRGDEQIAAGKGLVRWRGRRAPTKHSVHGGRVRKKVGEG